MKNYLPTIIGAVVNPMEGWANPPELRLIVDKDLDLLSTEFYNVERQSGGWCFVRTQSFHLGATSNVVFPIPSCFGLRGNDRFYGAGSDREYGLVDGWYDDGRLAGQAGIIGDTISVGVKSPRGTIMYNVPIETARAAMARFCPEWIIGERGDNGYYSSITKADGSYINEEG